MPCVSLKGLRVISHSLLVEINPFSLLRTVLLLASKILRRCHLSVPVNDLIHKVSCINVFHFHSSRSFILEIVQRGLGGGRAQLSSSLEMYHTCLTKVICKQKKRAIWEHAALPWIYSLSLCATSMPHYLQTAFSNCISGALPSFLSPIFLLGNFQNNLVLPSLFLWFDYWIINVVSALPHQAQHTAPPPLLHLTMKRHTINMNILLAVMFKEKLFLTITHKGQVIPQCTSYILKAINSINQFYSILCSLFICSCR